jgi:hypothetical protein
MENKFTEKESLALINEMINRARNNFNRNMTEMIFWGYLIAALSITNFVLLGILENKAMSYYVWFLAILGFIVSYFIKRRIKRTAIIKTHIDDIISMTWRGFSISVFVLWAFMFIFASFTKKFEILFMISPSILSMLGLCQFITAFVCRMKKMLWVAVLFWVGALLCIIPFNWENTDEGYIITFLQSTQQLIMAICMILGFVVPGHIINYRQKKNHV